MAIHPVLEFILLLVFVVAITWGISLLVGAVLWRKCGECESHLTRTARGWAMTISLEEPGFQYVEDLEC